MICKVRQTVERYNMPLNGKTVVVGLSGGADSMALLNVLLELRDEYGIGLIACHINHGIRGESADRDESFVRAECQRLGVELRVFHYDIPTLAKQQGIGLEECGRRARYDAFSSFGDCLVATAHTLSDRCETLLLNETRGSSARGLCSIPAVRDNIIRPLIDCTRAEIESYCNEKGIPYITDKTNLDDTYARNRIRLHVIPELKKINPSFENAIGRLIESVGDDEDYFNKITHDIIKSSKHENGYRASIISELHPSIKKRVVAEILKNEANINSEFVHIKMVCSILGGGKTLILKDTVVEVKNDILRVNPVNEDIPEWECDFSSLEAETPVGKVKAAIINKNNLPPKQNVHNKVLDFDSINGRLILRNRRSGDKMKLAGSSCTKSLKKLFSEKHLENRSRLLVLADDDGILWAENVGCADRCKIKNETKKILLITEECLND